MHNLFLDNYENFVKHHVEENLCTLCYKHDRNFLLFLLMGNILVKIPVCFVPKKWNVPKKEFFRAPKSDEVSVAETTLPTCINRHCGLNCTSYRHHGATCRRVLVAMATEITSYSIKYYNLLLLSVQYHKSNIRWRFDLPCSNLTLLMKAQFGYQRACSVKGSCARSQLHKLCG